MMLGSGDLGFSLRIAAVVVPVALYFLILGLLNSRRRPQLLRGRRDFALLLIALCPVFVLPVLYWVQNMWLALGTVGGAVGLAIAVLAPPRPSWVIYNITSAEARRAVRRALDAAQLTFRDEGRRFCLTDSDAMVELSGFPLLRNVSLRMTGADGDEPRRFETALAQTLDTIPAETTATTMALLLVATAMLAAPLALVAPRVPEIVRLLTGILY